MTFSFKQLHPNRRLFLVYYAAGLTAQEALAEVPGASGKPGMHQTTYEHWRKTDKLFVECMQHIDDDPDWCHDNIVAPLLLAQDDLMLVLKSQGIKVDPDKQWWGLSVKQRELLLNERRKLNQVDSVSDRFVDYMLRMEKNRENREKRELRETKLAALPAPTIIIEAEDTKEPET